MVGQDSAPSMGWSAYLDWRFGLSAAHLCIPPTALTYYYFHLLTIAEHPQRQPCTACYQYKSAAAGRRSDRAQTHHFSYLTFASWKSGAAQRRFFHTNFQNSARNWWFMVTEKELSSWMSRLLQPVFYVLCSRSGAAVKVQGSASV